MTDDATLEWLLDADPALTWQVERDLAGHDEETWQATRARVATEGFGAALLAVQDDDGQWASGAYFPKGEPGPGQPWTATTWSLNALREWGCDARALGDTAARLDANCRWEYDDLPYWGGEVDVCINAFTLANGAWLGANVHVIASWFLEHQMADGGWNCGWVDGSSRSSFHSTLNALRGLLYYEQAGLGSPELRNARRAGEEYLLERTLHVRRSTGESVGDWTRMFTYPGRWRYSMLRAADHFREASRFEGTTADVRLAAAIDEITSQRQPDGRWLQGTELEGDTWFAVDVPAGEASRWLTLSASRVLDWWHAERGL